MNEDFYYHFGGPTKGPISRRELAEKPSHLFGFASRDRKNWHPIHEVAPRRTLEIPLGCRLLYGGVCRPKRPQFVLLSLYKPGHTRLPDRIGYIAEVELRGYSGAFVIGQPTEAELRQTTGFAVPSWYSHHEMSVLLNDTPKGGQNLVVAAWDSVRWIGRYQRGFSFRQFFHDQRLPEVDL